ncbi:MAG: WavE lipopolysaccharide synthesis family protein [Chthoniobacteraceae bacterium]
MINPSQISVVMQGPVVGGSTVAEDQRLTRRCLHSVRQHLPGAQLVLATWKGSDVQGLDYDVLVECADPGSIKTFSPKATNMNRQIFSTQQGLLAVDRPYVLKLRTDSELTSAAFLEAFDRFPAVTESARIFQKRLVTWNLLTKFPLAGKSNLHHPSDMIFFGLREDVGLLWNIPLYARSDSELEEDRAFMEQGRAGHTPISYLTAEQYIWLSCIQKKQAVFLPTQPHPSDCRKSSELLVNNFTVLEPEQFGALWKGGQRLTYSTWYQICSHAEWQQFYRQFCDRKFKAAIPWELVPKRIIYFLLTRATIFPKAYRWFYYKLEPEGYGREPQPIGKLIWKKIRAVVGR